MPIEPQSERQRQAWLTRRVEPARCRSPPLVITSEQIDWAVEQLEAVLWRLT